MTPEGYSYEIIEAAEELYIIDGLTFDQVAERTGVSVSQLKRWSGDSSPDWPERRREYRQAQVSIRRGVMLAKAKLIESVISTEDAQKAYAFGALVNSSKIIEAEAKERNQLPATQPETPAGETPDVLAALNQGIQQKIALLMSSPGTINLAEIKGLIQGLEIVEKYKNKDVTAEDKQVDAETIKSIREQFGL